MYIHRVAGTLQSMIEHLVISTSRGKITIQEVRDCGKMS